MPCYTSMEKYSKKKSSKPISFSTAVSFISISINQKLFPITYGVPALRISVSVYHNTGAINWYSSKMYAMLLDGGDTHSNHFFTFTNQDFEIHIAFMDIIRQYNPFLQSAKQALKENSSVPLVHLIISDEAPPKASTRIYNKPTLKEISIFSRMHSFSVQSVLLGEFWILTF